MSKAWGGAGAGAWALDAERAEAEEQAAAAAAFPVLGEPANPESFPSLKEAVSTGGKTKKKKPVAISLSQFTTGTYVGPGGRAASSALEPRGLTPDELLRLPTGPRERSEEELQIGRGFRSYGLSGGPRDGGPSRRPYGAGFDDEQRRGPPPRAAAEFDQPSRADEVDNWASEKKSFSPAHFDSGRPDRYSSLGGGGGGGGMGIGSSRADEDDNWAARKKPLPSRHSSFGSGFRDSPASVSDRWVRGGPLPHNGERERPRLVLDPPKRDVELAAEPARSRPNPFGAARPREEVLTEKGLDWKKMDTEIELKKTSRPTSAHSSRPSSAHSSRPGSPGSQAGGAEGAPKARPKVNPFGDAKPREVLLQERGKDWRKIDMELEHRRVGRPDTEQERLLKEEINQLMEVLAKETEGGSKDESTEKLATLRERIHQRERDLEDLVHQLDDKIRFGQKVINDRPGSGSGRMTVPSDRPSSQSGRSDDSRGGTDFMERPQSRGSTGDAWAKPMDDGRGFRGGRESGFFGNRSMDRSKSRERW